MLSLDHQLPLPDLILQATTQLAACEVATARLDVLVICETVLQQNRAFLLASTATATKEDVDLIQAKLRWRCAGMPLAYILNNKEFYGRSFTVNLQTLIPRPESEMIIELALQHVQEPPATIVDLGCGSGCLGITYALESGYSAGIKLVDISAPALEVAQHNASKLNVQAQPLCADFTSSSNPVIFAPQGLLLANLPYVPRDQRQHFEEKSPGLAYEPASAIYAAEQGLGLYRQLFAKLVSLDTKPLAVIVESLTSQHHQLLKFARMADYSERAFKTAGATTTSCLTLI